MNSHRQTSVGRRTPAAIRIITPRRHTERAGASAMRLEFARPPGRSRPPSVSPRPASCARGTLKAAGESPAARSVSRVTPLVQARSFAARGNRAIKLRGAREDPSSHRGRRSVRPRVAFVGLATARLFPSNSGAWLGCLATDCESVVSHEGLILFVRRWFRRL